MAHFGTLVPTETPTNAFIHVYDGSHLALPSVEYHQVRSFALESAGHESLNLDGEMKGTTPFAAEVLPSALRLFGARSPAIVSHFNRRGA